MALTAGQSISAMRRSAGALLRLQRLLGWRSLPAKLAKEIQARADHELDRETLHGVAEGYAAARSPGIGERGGHSKAKQPGGIDCRCSRIGMGEDRGLQRMQQ